MIPPRISDFLADFKPRTHVIVFYDTPENKHELLFNHLKFGASGNEGLAYVCSEEKPAEIRGEMKAFGLDVDSLQTWDRLAINNYNRIYIVDGEVNIPNIMSAFSEMVKKYNAMSLAGMRAAAEMSCFFNEGKVKELVEYEYALHRRFSFQAEGICAYNIHDLVRSGNLGMIMPLVRAHDPVILTGPKDSLLLEPDKVEKKDIQETMKIKI